MPKLFLFPSDKCICFKENNIFSPREEIPTLRGTLIQQAHFIIPSTVHSYYFRAHDSFFLLQGAQFIVPTSQCTVDSTYLRVPVYKSYFRVHS